MTSRCCPYLLASVLCGFWAAPAHGDVTLPAIFSDHAVLQGSDHVPIWGRGAPGEAVTVSLDHASATTQADASGAWKVTLNLHQEGPGPYALTVKGQNQLVIQDVLVGEVWLCSGQSNMELSLAATANAPAEIAASSNTLLRQFKVEKKGSLDPLGDCTGHWVVAGPTTSGGFTAVGYYFGKAVQQKLQVPVGIVNSSWGGSTVEAWMSAEAMDGDPDLKAAKDKIYEMMRDYPAKTKAYTDQYEAWAAQYQRQDRPYDSNAYAAPAVSTADWTPVKVPGAVAEAGLPDAGAIWLRCRVQVAPGGLHTYHPLHVALGDFDAVYWNGTKVGETTAENSTAINTSTQPSNIRRYDVPATAITPGDNILALRIFAPAGGAGTALPGFNKIAEPGLTFGPWLAKAEFALPPLPDAARAAYPAHPLIPAAMPMRATYLYNGMIAPLLPDAIRGVVWYQGESNVDRAMQYRTALRLMIQDWRAKWQEGDLPFYICQLPNYLAKKPAPSESAWAELRESQASVLDLPQTGLAVLIDLGEEGNIHPKDKKDVGERVAQLALAKTYGETIPWTAPVYAGLKIEGGQARITFAHAEEGLVAQALPDHYQVQSSSPETKPLVRNSPGSELEGFAICGADHAWKWAQARIDNGTVVVSSPDVPAPVAVRYAWADNPTCNLYSRSGLPVAPFRTDDFPVSTTGKKY